MKPKCTLTGQDGNIFNLIGVASKVLKNNNLPDKATEMTNRVFKTKSYEEALATIAEYVEVD